MTRRTPPRPLPRPRQPLRITAPAALQWRAVADRLRTAAVAGGVYALVSDGLAYWTAQWRPAGGRVEHLLMRSTEQLAAAACTQHHHAKHADAALLRDGREELTGRDTTGPALAWKRR